jgi:hypothetical protein
MTAQSRIPDISRRQFLQGSVGSLAALAAVAQLPLTPQPQDQPSSGPATTSSWASTVITDEPAVHVSQRLTFGSTADLVEHLRKDSVDGFIEEQLAPDAIDDSAIDDLLSEFQTLSLSNAEILANYREQAGLVIGELLAATILRAIYSRRQLYEIMVDFWTNHLNIYIGDGLAPSTQRTNSASGCAR